MGKLSTLIVDLQLQSAQIKSELKVVQQRLGDFGTAATQAGSKLEALNRSALKTGDVVKAVFSAGILTRGADALFDFVKSGAKGMLEEEKASERLGAALRTMGYDAGALVPVFQRQADAIEQTTLLGPEFTNQIQQMLIQYGVAPNAVEGATQAIVDYAAATGKDAVGATQTLLNAVSTGKEEITKLGISYQSTGSLTEDLISATDALEKKFGGSAAAATEGMSGQIGKLSKAFEILSESLAKFVMQSGIGEAVTKLLTGAAQGLTAAVSDDGQEEERTADRVARYNELMATRTRLLDQYVGVEQELAKASGDAGKTSFLTRQRDELNNRLAQVNGDLQILERYKQAANASKTSEAARENAAVNSGQSAAAAAVEADRKRKAAETKWLKDQAEDAASRKLGKQTSSRFDDISGAGRFNATEMLNLAGPAKELKGVVVREVKSFGQVYSETMRYGAEVLNGVVKNIGAAVLSNSGTFGATIQAAMEGGPIAAITELLTSSKQFAKLNAILSDIGQIVSDTLGQVFEELIPPVRALGGIVAIASQALKPLTPLFTLFGMGLAMVIRALQPVIEFVLQPLFIVLRWVAEKAVQFVRWIGEAWNFVSDTLVSVLDFLAAVTTGDLHNSIASVARALRGQKFNLDDLTAMYQQLHNMTWEQARAAAEETEAALGASDALNDFAEEVLNAPAGFKALAAYAFTAANPEGSAPGAHGASGAGGGGGTTGGNPGTGWTSPNDHTGGTSWTPGGTGSGLGGTIFGKTSPTTQVFVSADLKRYVKVEGRTSGYSDAGGTASGAPFVPAMDLEG